MEGFSFTDDGPFTSGTWINSHTGDKFTVAESYFQDMQIVVKTTDGRTLSGSQLTGYIKSCDENNAFIKTKSDVENTKYIPEKCIKSSDKKQDKITEEVITRALLNKPMPEISTKLSWNTPQHEINALVDIMNVSKEEIVNWYVEQMDIILKNELKEKIKNNLEEFIFAAINSATYKDV